VCDHEDNLLLPPVLGLLPVPMDFLLPRKCEDPQAHSCPSTSFSFHTFSLTDVYFFLTIAFLPPVFGPLLLPFPLGYLHHLKHDSLKDTPFPAASLHHSFNRHTLHLLCARNVLRYYNTGANKADLFSALTKLTVLV
jgi:hypothetical protein